MGEGGTSGRGGMPGAAGLSSVGSGGLGLAVGALTPGFPSYQQLLQHPRFSHLTPQQYQHVLLQYQEQLAMRQVLQGIRAR